MGLLSPGPGQKPHRAKNVTSADELTDAAELVVMLFPADASSATEVGAKDADSTTAPHGRLMRLLYRIGLHACVRVPAASVAELLGTVRLIAWVVLVLGTLAIMIPAGMPAWAFITVIAIGSAGFII